MVLTPQHVLSATIFFSSFMLLLLMYIIIALAFKNKREKDQRRWLNKINILITKAIFFDNDEFPEFHISLNNRISLLVQNTHFRQALIDELVISSKSISGTSADNLCFLYNQLGLENDSFRNLQSRFWHKKAKAIQELAVMNQVQYSTILYKLTNHKNEFIRMEAQRSMVKFHGFAGLKFLEEMTYPLSEWHQINLLKELSSLAASEFKGIDNWLKSKNDSVIVFALRLCSSYHQFDMYDKIVDCLNHSNPKVRLQAINCLKQVYENTTAWQLMRIYKNESKMHQLAILQALQEIASEDSISFLQNQIGSDDYQIKLAAARALHKTSFEGDSSLDSVNGAEQYPLREIIQQIKMEK